MNVNSRLAMPLAFQSIGLPSETDFHARPSRHMRGGLEKSLEVTDTSIVLVTEQKSLSFGKLGRPEIQRSPSSFAQYGLHVALADFIGRPAIRHKQAPPVSPTSPTGSGKGHCAAARW